MGRGGRERGGKEVREGRMEGEEGRTGRHKGGRKGEGK